MNNNLLIAITLLTISLLPLICNNTNTLRSLFEPHFLSGLRYTYLLDQVIAV